MIELYLEQSESSRESCRHNSKKFNGLASEHFVRDRKKNGGRKKKRKEEESFCIPERRLVSVIEYMSSSLQQGLSSVGRNLPLSL